MAYGTACKLNALKLVDNGRNMVEVEPVAVKAHRNGTKVQ